MMEFSRALGLAVGLGQQVASSWPSERIELRGAVGRVLARDVCAEAPVPLHDYSAMDGYAVRAADCSERSESQLPVVGEIFAGDGARVLEPGTTLRIFTGAPLPAGADAVVMQENVERQADSIRIVARPQPWENVRRAGEDLQTGALALPRGHRVSPFSVGLLATLERSEVEVAARPRVAILCTGDELRPPGRPGAPGLAESNSIALDALVSQVGGTASRLALVGDSLEETRRALQRALSHHDVVLTVGGVSVGDHDYVRPALAALGAESVFSKVRMKPGKPVTLAKVGQRMVFGLPGNPASAQVTFALFAAPLLRALQGEAQVRPRFRRAILETPVRQKPGRQSFYRALLEEGRVSLFDNQASGAGTAMAWANCLLVVPEDVETLAPGEEVSVLCYDDV